MAIQHIPSAGDVLTCDFGPDPKLISDTGVLNGPLAVPPEIFKNRRVVVLSTIGRLSIVVPFTTSVPDKLRKFHVHIPAESYDFMHGNLDSWLKADLIESVSHLRLDRIRVGGNFRHSKLTPAHMKLLKAAVLHALQMGALEQHL